VKAMRLAVLLALVLLVLGAIPVSAASPVVTTEKIEFNYEVFVPSPCPGIEVWDHEVITMRTTSFYDKEGNLLQQQIFFKGIDNLYNPLNPDVVLSGPFSATVHINARTGEMYATGVAANIHVPGYGIILLKTGRWNWALYPGGHLGGRDTFQSEKDMREFCSCLAGN